MRFIPSYCIRENMRLGVDIIGSSGEIMLTRGTLLTPKYVEGIIRLKYNGIYIEDEWSQDIEIQNVISDTLRASVVKGIKDIFIQTENGNTRVGAMKSEAIKLQIENIVQDILNNRNLMVNMIDMKVFDDYTYYHSVNVAVTAIILGVACGLSRDALVKLGIGALLHDIGKVFVEKEIVNKNGPLSKGEYSAMKEHPMQGYKYVKEYFDVPIHSYAAILDHHERWDGAGYPNGKKGSQISTYGRLIAIADVYDALTSDRPYRKALLPSEAMEYIMGGSGSQFDPSLVKLFTQKIAPYPVGTCVKLSNGVVGVIVENYSHSCMRPKIKPIQHPEGVLQRGIEHIDLFFRYTLQKRNNYRNSSSIDMHIAHNTLIITWDNPK